MADHHKYNTELSGVKSRVRVIDPNYFEKKRESLRPEVRRQKLNADAGAVEIIKAIDYLPSHLFDKEKNEGLVPERSGALTRDDS